MVPVRVPVRVVCAAVVDLSKHCSNALIALLWFPFCRHVQPNLKRSRMESEDGEDGKVPSADLSNESSLFNGEDDEAVS